MFKQFSISTSIWVFYFYLAFVKKYYLSAYTCVSYDLPHENSNKTARKKLEIKL